MGKSSGLAPVWEVGGDWLGEGRERNVGSDGKVCLEITVIVVTCAYESIKANQSLHIKWVHFIAYKWYLNKIDSYTEQQFLKIHTFQKNDEV